MEATPGETNGEEFPGSFLGFACDREWLLGNPSMTGVKSSGNPHERSSWDARSGRSFSLISEERMTKRGRTVGWTERDGG